MGFLAFNGQKPDVVAPKIEDSLRTELGATAALGYSIESGDVAPTTAGTVLKEGLGLLLGGRKESILFTVHFSLPAPRPLTLAVHVARQGIGSHVSGLLYSASLSKQAPGEVTLDDKGKFQGEASLAAKLNGDKALVKRCVAFSRTAANLGGVDVTVPRFFKLAPEGNGSALVVGTLPKVGMLGFKVTLDAKEFLELAPAIEALI